MGMRRRVVLVAERPTLFPLFATASRVTRVIEGWLAELEYSILKIVKGAHAGHLLGLKTTQQRVQRLLVEALDPDLDRGDVALQHE